MSEILWCADNGDGTYRNPVLYCDYSDPDAICVNGTYYRGWSQGKTEGR